MKLKAFNSENSMSVTDRNPHIRLNRNGGLITFNSGCRNLCDLKSGTLVEFYQNEECPKDWYFGVSKKGFKLRNKDNADSFTFNSSHTVKSILQSLGLLNVTLGISFPVSPAKISNDGNTIFQILTETQVNRK
jgi:hypothetical protein